MATIALLADRDPETRTICRDYLRRFEYEVDEAEDGREALAKAIARCPRVVVAEARLPGISGVELCRLLRNDPSTKAASIIVVSGDGSAADLRVAEAAGADAVLVKPCRPEQLAEQVRSVLLRSAEVRLRGSARTEGAPQVGRPSEDVIARAQTTARRVMLSHAYQRVSTTDPPARPPALVCPICDRRLVYVRSHLGGVNQRFSEQWDYFDCAHGCGTFQYRHRTRKIRRDG
jgi:DNA-binding response OmpR family regulator